MSRNVRCVGGLLVNSGCRDAVRSPSCGWRGERYTFHAPTIGPSWLELPNPDYAAALTRKPCPRCGGRVELIERAP